LEIKRNALYNLDEIKVRWKKAALENCPGVPCVVTPPAPSFTCGTSTVLDFDGNSYNTVLIGTQCWTKENLKVTVYNDGTSIPDSTNSTWGTAAIGARTEYVNAGVGYVGTFGYLYNWYAASDPRKLCPTGWHVPINGEWTSLIQYIDPSATTSGFQMTTAGGRMKETVTNLWSSVFVGTDNSSGFSARPGGLRTNTIFTIIGVEAYFWSSTSQSTSTAFTRILSHNFDDVVNTGISKKSGASIRCIMD
jgi:uncharacterized protein (TIGR02145 family)